MTDRITIDTGEDRYSRLRMIPWWDQELLARSKVMVVGAGALGNEIIKNLALLGIGSILIVDFDTVEESNLSRSVLFRPKDEGQRKARAAAKAAREINPDCHVFSLHADITREVGLGVFRWADVVICGLDNREARLAVNKACWKVNRPWVDGATEALQGIARVFVPPDGVCYECTLGEQDQRIMAFRDSCGFFGREAYRQGHTPTTPTTSAVIAGIQVQEAIRLLHAPGLVGAKDWEHKPVVLERGSSSQSFAPTVTPAAFRGYDTPGGGLTGKGFFFDGGSYECFTIDYTRREDCLSHETFENVIATDLASDRATLADVMREAARHIEPTRSHSERSEESALAKPGGKQIPRAARNDLGDLVIDLPSEMLTALECAHCHTREKFHRLLRAATADQVRCPTCGAERVPDVVAECEAGSGFGSMPLLELGFGIMDIVAVRSGERSVQVEISGDAEKVFITKARKKGNRER